MPRPSRLASNRTAKPATTRVRSRIRSVKRGPSVADKSRAVERPRTEADRAANPVSTRLVDEKHLIERVPLADPVALGTATPIPPAIVNDRIPVDPDPEMVLGEPIPEPERMTAEDQNRIEVLTGKRLQHDSKPVQEQKPTRDVREK